MAEGARGDRVSDESFAALLERRAPVKELVDWFSGRKRMSAASWMELVPPAAEPAGGLDWMPDPDRQLVRACILDFVLQAFTEFWPAEHPAGADLRRAMKGFTAWVESLPDSTVVPFCWDLLAYGRSTTPEPVWWLKRSGRLSGAISHKCLSLAVSLADEADAMCWWPKERWSVVSWDLGSAPYFEDLSEKSVGKFRLGQFAK